jgi:hypothetical protein
VHLSEVCTRRPRYRLLCVSRVKIPLQLLPMNPVVQSHSVAFSGLMDRLNGAIFGESQAINLGKWNLDTWLKTEWSAQSIRA